MRSGSWPVPSEIWCSATSATSWAAVLRATLRLVQGFALGGEWAGAVLLVGEHGSARHRGLRASLPQAGVPLGILPATGVLGSLSATMDDAAFLDWGRRVPFLLSAVLVVFAGWVRWSVQDAPVFTEARARHDGPPALGALRRHPEEIAVCISARMVENISYYIITSFVLTYVTTRLELDQAVALRALLLANAVHLVAIPVFGASSDRLGRRPVHLAGTIGMGLWALLFFPLLDTRDGWLLTVAVVGGLITHAAMYGPQAAFWPRRSSPRRASSPPPKRATATSPGARRNSFLSVPATHPRRANSVNTTILLLRAFP